MLLFFRYLDSAHAADQEIILDVHRNQRWNKINSVVMRVHDNGACSFFPIDSDILEPLS